jgi:hypothetical protein
MSNEYTLAVRAALHNGGGAAENQLTIIAHEHGDEQLALVIEDLTAPEIIAIVEEGDMTKPSLASAFATAEQFLSALERKVDGWKHFYGRMNKSALSDSMMNLQADIESFICPMIYSADLEVREREMMTALANYENGPELAMLAAVGRKDFIELFTQSPDFHPTRGTWQSLLVHMQDATPQRFKDLKSIYKLDGASAEYQEAVLDCAYELLKHLEVAEVATKEQHVDEFIDF